MIETKKLFNFLKKNKINFFSGVPDSVLKNTKIYFEKLPSTQHMVTSNEGSSIALCIGYHLSTGNLPCAYMQNSGLGNAINPLISIAHKKVYSIPLLLLIGWRGAPGIKDEPQHELKGSITINLLKLLGIKHCIIKKDQDFKKLQKLINFSKKENQPVACLFRKNTLNNDYSKKTNISKKSSILRGDIIKELLNKIDKNTKLISTTGFTSRELNQIRNNLGTNKGSDFYMVGGMGHSSIVSLGVSLKTKKNVICLDGDGSFLMHLGSIATISKIAGKNFKHVLFNNYSHESVGGQTTNIDKLNIKNLVLSSGYKRYFKIKAKKQVSLKLEKFLKLKGPSFLEINISSGSLKNLKRPKNLQAVKKKFMNSFKKKNEN